MDDKTSMSRDPDSRRRDEWTGINFLIGEMEGLRERGLVSDESCRTIVGEYMARRNAIEQSARFETAIKMARELATISPREALAWSTRARDLNPDRPEGWIVGVELLRKQARFAEADRLHEEAVAKFPDLARPQVTRRFEPRPEPTVASYPQSQAAVAPVKFTPPPPKISWSSVTGEFLQEHWQKLISCLAVLLIVVSSTVGANLVLGPLLWSPIGKGVLALVFTTMSAVFGVGLVKWGAERAGQMMLATTLTLIPINFMLIGGLGLLVRRSSWDLGLFQVEAALLFLLTRWVVGALGIGSGGSFTSLFFAIALFNAGASRGIPLEVGLPIFLTPAAFFLGAVAWLNKKLLRRVELGEKPPLLRFSYLEFGLLCYAFLAGVIWTGAMVLHLPPSLYAIPTMLAAIAVVSTARVIEPVEKDHQRALVFLEAGLTLSALSFGQALARPLVPASALYSGNTLGVAILGLTLYAGSLRATRKPAYLYCAFAALFLGYFGTFYFAKDLVHSVEEAARAAMGYQQALPAPFKAINGLVFSVGLALLAGFFQRSWSDDRLARHCHYIGLPLSIGACVFSGFEPKAAVICLSGYAILYALGTRVYRQPLLIYLSCAAVAGSAYFGASLAGSTPLALQSMLASILGLAFWIVHALPPLREAGESYQTPLIRSARVMAACAMAAATLASIQAGVISPLATLAFLLTAILTLLNGSEAPRFSVYLLALGSLLGAWLGGFHILNGQQPASLMAYALAIACYSSALLAAGEAARFWFGDSRSTEAYLEVIAGGVTLCVAVAWLLAGWSLVNNVTVARSFLVGSVSLLWLTRFRRESVLVYLGLSGLAIWSACLCGLVIPWDRRGLAVAWLAVDAGGVSLVLCGIGEWVRRRGDRFYYHPCFLMASILAGLASILAFEGWWLQAESFRVGLIACLAGMVGFGLIAWSMRWPAAVALSIVSAIGASDLVVLGQGMTGVESAWWLSLVFVVEAIVCRGVGELVRWIEGEPASELARPLDYGALILAFAALPGGYNSPTILLLLAVASVLMIGCFPAADWLYATFLAVGAAVYQVFLTRLTANGLLPVVMVGAYLAWGVGVASQEARYRLGRWLGRLDLPFERPAERTSIAMGVLALLIRIKTVGDAGGVWTGQAWLPWSLGLLCLLMLRFQPRGRGWVHASAGFTGLGFTAMLAPVLDPQVWWVSASVARTLFWAVAARVAIRGEEWFRKRLGITPGFDAEVFREWSIAMFGLSAVAVTSLVVASTAFSSFETISGVIPGGWRDVMLAIELCAIYVGLEGRRFDVNGRWIGLEVVALLALWWFGASSSILPFDRDSYLALVTSGFALGVVLLGFEVSRRRQSRLDDPLFDPGPEPRLGLRLFTSWFGFGLGLSTVYFVIFTRGWVALPSLLLATGALGLLALAWRRFESAIAGGVTWCLAVAVGFAQVFWSVTAPGASGESLAVASGLLLALGSLWMLARWLQVRAVGKSGELAGDLRVASAFESVAIAATAPAGFIVLIDSSGSRLGSSVVVFGLAVFYAMVAWRRRAEWPVYVAQVLLLGAYLRSRDVLLGSGVADAVLLSLLGFLDLGLSELMGRLKLENFARPTLRFAMVLPLVSIIQAIWNGVGDGSNLFVLLATSGFYVLASLRLRSKTPAYAAAVLFNAFLWLAWYRLGWRFVDRPEFYLVPVGFSSILFAEVNRKELSKAVLNGARNLGLVVIYASLASPIWQHQSFGAWLVLLLLSLLGIFVGIGLRIQSFLWLGLVTFLADITYQLTRLGMEHALARWGVMLSLGVALILFVALNEKKRIVATIRGYYDEARTWE